MSYIICSQVDKDYMPGLMCIRDMEPDAQAFAAMDMSFSTPSAAGHEVQLSARYETPLSLFVVNIYSCYFTKLHF